MTQLSVRRLLIDLEPSFARHWFGGDPFRTALFNALSMSFPAGEQFFIDAVRRAHQALPADQRAAFDAEVRGFVGQEATHRRIHALFNGHLQAQGYVNEWEQRIPARVAFIERGDPRHALAATACYEHFTAIFAEWLLRHPARFDGVEPRLAAMWQWHSAEESEHRGTAFDLYVALGGDRRWRVRWMRIVTFHFVGDLARQTVCNLKRDGELWRWRTWKSGARTLFGRGGLIRECFGPWREWFRRDFHPMKQAAPGGARWLEQNAQAYSLVGQAPQRPTAPV